MTSDALITAITLSPLFESEFIHHLSLVIDDVMITPLPISTRTSGDLAWPLCTAATFPESDFAH